MKNHPARALPGGVEHVKMEESNVYDIIDDRLFDVNHDINELRKQVMVLRMANIGLFIGMLWAFYIKR